MKQLEYVLKNQGEVLGFLKSRFPMYHLSNFFFRDLQYGIRMFLDERKMKVGYMDAETIARKFAEALEGAKIFKPIDHQSLVVNYPDYRKPQVKPAAPAKSAGPAPAVSRGAVPPAVRPAPESSVAPPAPNSESEAGMA